MLLAFNLTEAVNHSVANTVEVIRPLPSHRFEDMPEVIDDSLPGPIHDSLSDSLVDQDVILEM